MADNTLTAFPAPSDKFPASGVRTFRAALGFLLALTVFRLWYITHIQLVPDETYYWLWSKHLALSYRDKGPLVAWTIWLGTHLFGDTAFGVRFMAVLLAAGTSWQLFSLARRLYDDRTALWSLVVLTIIPLFAGEFVLMTIDPLSLFFWAWAMNLFWTALERGTVWRWSVLGLLIGLGFLAKFTNGVQLACIGLFLCWSKPHRHWLISRHFFAMCVAFSITILPLIYWNVQTGWVHFGALHSRSGVDQSFSIHPRELFKFIGGEMGIFSPLLAIGLIVATVGLLRKQRHDLRTRFLMSQFLPLCAIFLFFSLNKAGKENWTAPALLAGIILMVVFWRDLAARQPKWRRAIYPAVGMAIVMTFFGHFSELLPLPPVLDPQRSARGWDDYAAHVQRAREKYQTALLIGNRYQEASTMAYYLPDRPRTFLPKEKYGKSQFSLWPGYDLSTNTCALYVTTAKNKHPPPFMLLRDFPKYEVVDEFWSQHHGRPMTPFRIYVCRRD